MATATLAALTPAAVRQVVDAARRGAPVLVEHGLVPYDVPSGPALDALVDAVPLAWQMHLSGAVPVVPGECAPICEPAGAAALPHHQAGTRISRVAHLNLTPAMREVSAAVLDPLHDAWPVDEPWRQRDTALFLSSPGGVTGAHADRHHTLLLQVAGTKQVAVGRRPRGRAGRQAAAILHDAWPDLRLASMPSDAVLLDLPQGWGLYLPPFAAHWVRTGPAPGVAVSCAWRTPATEVDARLLDLGARLRRRGLPTNAPGGRLDPLRLALHRRRYPSP